MKNVIDDIPNLDNEIWIRLSDFDNKYEISNYGRIKSYKYRQPYLLIPEENSTGYLRVTLHKNGKRYRKFVHRLVAYYFVPNDDPDNKKTVNHINNDKKLNTYKNLEWLSLSDNIKAYYNKIKKTISSDNSKR